MPFDLILAMKLRKIFKIRFAIKRGTIHQRLDGNAL
jgi:hypothetical protein